MVCISYEPRRVCSIYYRNPDGTPENQNEYVMVSDWGIFPVSVELEPEEALPLPDKPSIAVLPFANMSDDPDQEWFADGMTDDLITDLSQISGLFVIARNSSFQYKGQAVDVKTVGRKLGVKYVLEGSVRRAGDQVRINAQLIDATTGGHVWAERYDGAAEDIFALQDKVTRKIVAAMSVELTEQEEQAAAVSETDSVAAYDAFVRGWQHHQRETAEDYGKAKSYFEKAIEIDPDYARAYAALALTYLDAAEHGWYSAVGLGGWATAMANADRLLQTSFEKGETPLAHAAMAILRNFFYQYEKAIEHAERAVALAPNDPVAQVQMGWALIWGGEPERAIGHFERAMRLNPHYPPDYTVGLGWAHFSMNQLDEAAALFERALERNTEDWVTAGYLAATYAHLGRQEEVEAAIQKWIDGGKAAEGFYPGVGYATDWGFKDWIVKKRWLDGLRKAGLE